VCFNANILPPSHGQIKKLIEIHEIHEYIHGEIKRNVDAADRFSLTTWPIRSSMFEGCQTPNRGSGLPIPGESLLSAPGLFFDFVPAAWQYGIARKPKGYEGSA